MTVHLHHARTIMGWILGIAVFSPFALYFEPADTKEPVSEVSGRVTYSGRPVQDMIICLDSEGGGHCAFGLVKHDGSFNLLNMRGLGSANPGRYYAHLFKFKDGTPIPTKYDDPKKSGLAIEIAPDWCELDIDLH